MSTSFAPNGLHELALGGLFASPSLLCSGILFIPATTSTPLADRVLLMAHPSVMRAFTVPITVWLSQDTLLADFTGGSTFGAVVFS
jgi:hypothetical protein